MTYSKIRTPMRAGTVVANRFAIERPAGAGGMGTVYRARDRHTGELVAIKVLRDSDHDRGRRFVKEAEVLFQLRHPRIVRYVAHGKTAQGELYLVMEWLEGESLGQRLRRDGLSIHDAYEVALAIAEASSTAHAQGILHRDIKPGNLILVDGDIKRVKLLDFGLARAGSRTGDALTATGELLGTPGYMAPEQARGDKTVDARADVFSIGCVLFRCFTGRRAFEGDDALAVLAKLILETPPRVAVLRPGLPPQLDGLIARMLSKSPDDRPANGRSVYDELLAMGTVIRSAELASLDAEPARSALPSITVKEQRVMCLVLARLASTPRPDGGTRTAYADQEQVEQIAGAVQPFGGSVDQLIDGTLMVTVATGTALEQATRAGRCALAVRHLVGAVPIALAAGRGLVTRGALLGEAIDRAAALLNTQGTGAIRLDDAAATLMREHFTVVRDTSGYVLKSARAEGEQTRRLLGKQTSIVGRGRELNNLEAMFEECVAEPVARAVLVTAPPGMGKSRLRYELMRRLHARETVPNEQGEETAFHIWLARGDPMCAGAAFGMVASALRQALGIRVGEPLAVRRRQVLARVSARVSPDEVTRVCEFVGELIGTPFDDDRSVQLRSARQDPMVMGDQMRRAFEDFVRAESAVAPVLIVLEDLHWGDLPSVTLLDSVLRNLDEAPLMVLAFARPEVHELFPNLWIERDRQEVRLSRLTKKAASKLVREVLGAQTDGPLVDRLVERAEGNAFYLEELIRAVAEGKGDTLPESVLAVVQSRLDELDGEARRVLRGASIFGQVFWKSGVAAMLGKERAGDLDDWLMALQERELITKRADSRFPGDVELVFRHALLREAAYAALTENDRELGHRLAGSWLETAGEKESRVLAKHFERGGDAAGAVRWYQRAAEQALEGHDLQAALMMADRGVASGAREEALGKLRLLQADAHRWRGEFAEMEARASVAMKALPRGEAAWCKAVAEIAVACRALSRYDQLVFLADELQGLSPLPHFEAAYTEAVARTAIQLFMIGWTEHGDALLERIAEAEGSLRDSHPAVVAWTYHARAFRGLYAGDAGAYMELSGRAASRFEAAGDLRSEVNARVHLGFGYNEVGAYSEAETALREALAAAERLGLFNVVASSLNNLGMALARLGRLAEARETELEAIRLAAAQGDRRVEGGSRHYLAIIGMLGAEPELQARTLETAEANASAAVELLEVSPSLRAHALATLAEVQQASGRSATALKTAQMAMDLLRSLGGIEEGETTVRLVFAKTLHACGQQARARAVIEQAARRLHERAAKITDSRWRQSFLERVVDNARTIALATMWSTGEPTLQDEDTLEDPLTADLLTSSHPPES